LCGSRGGNCESKGLRPDKTNGGVPAIVLSDWDLYKPKNVVRTKVIVGRVIRKLIC